MKRRTLKKKCVLLRHQVCARLFVTAAVRNEYSLFPSSLTFSLVGLSPELSREDGHRLVEKAIFNSTWGPAHFGSKEIALEALETLEGDTLFRAAVTHRSLSE